MTSLRAAAASHPGLVRSSNQDSALVADGLVAVADGMGGHAGGEVAARTAVRVLEEAFATDRSATGLVSAARQANGAIYAHSERQKELRGMGTTLTAAALVRERGGERLAVVNVGDSRAYLVTAEGIVQLTEDHSLVEEMVRHGEMTQAEAAVHPHRHILTRALGIDPSVEVDTWALEPHPGSRLLLCSDGLTNECSDEEIGAILRQHPDPAAAAGALVERALVHGGSDNVTVVVADVLADERPAGRAGAAAAASAAGAPPDGGDPSRRAAQPAEPARSARAGRHDGARGARGSAAPSAARPAAPPATAPAPAGRAAGARERRARPTRRHRRGADRVVTVWSVLFVLAFVGVLGGAAGFVEWYVRATYFVGFDGGRVAIYEGRPGGFLWFKPHVVELTPLTRSKVFPPYVPLVQKAIIETSFSAAKKVASRLGDANAFLALPTAAASRATSVPAPTFAPVSTATTLTSAATTTGAAGTTGASAGAGAATPTSATSGSAPVGPATAGAQAGTSPGAG